MRLCKIAFDMPGHPVDVLTAITSILAHATLSGVANGKRSAEARHLWTEKRPHAVPLRARGVPLPGDVLSDAETNGPQGGLYPLKAEAPRDDGTGRSIWSRWAPMARDASAVIATEVKGRTTWRQPRVWLGRAWALICLASPKFGRLAATPRRSPGSWNR